MKNIHIDKSKTIMCTERLTFFQWIYCWLIYFSAKQNPKDAHHKALVYFSTLRLMNMSVIYILLCVIFVNISYEKSGTLIIFSIFLWIVDYLFYLRKLDNLLLKFNNSPARKRCRWKIITYLYIAVSIISFFSFFLL